MNLVLLAIILLFQNAVNALENLLYQLLVAVQDRMKQSQSLGMRLRNTLIQTHRGYLHQQSGLFVLVGQFEIMAHHGLNNKGPVQVIGAGDGSSWHQVILFATDHYRLRQLVIFCVGIERTSVCIKPHLRICTHVNGTIQSRFQELNIKAKLILIRPTRCVIKIKVELPDMLLALRQIPTKQLTSTNDLNTSARATKKANHRLWQFLCQLPNLYCFLISLKVINL